MKKLTLIALIAVTALLFSSCSSKAPPSVVSSVSDIDGKLIGVIENTTAAHYAANYGEVKTFSTGEAMIAELVSGAIDCAVADESIVPQLTSNSRRVKALDEPLMSADFCIAAAKQSSDLLDEINAALQALRTDGTLSAIEDSYAGGNAYYYTPRSDIPDSAGKLRLAVSGDFPPYSKRDVQGELTGLDIDVARAVCDLLGVKLEIVETGRSSVAKTVWSSRADFGMGGIYSGGSNSELVDLSDGYITCTLRVITRK